MPAPASRLTLASPTSSAAASAIAWNSASWLTSGAKIRRKSTSAVAPKPAATPLTMRRMPCSTSVIVSRFIVRTVPPSVAVCGITL